MSSVQCTRKTDPEISILFAHAADEELKSLVLPCLYGFQEIYTVDNGSEALEQYHTKRICMVVAALDLGDMTGFELCARILVEDPEAQVVLIGREHGESVYKAAMEVGVVRYIIMDEHATDTLWASVNKKYALCRVRNTQQQTSDTLRLQADALQSLRLPVALLTADGELLSANRTFKSMFNGISDSGYSALSTVLDALSVVSPKTGWNSLLQAAAQGSEWSGDIICRGRNGTRIYIHAALSRFHEGPCGTNYHQLLIMDDITAHVEQRSTLAVQRDSAFEIIESLHSVQTCLETIQPSISKVSVQNVLAHPDDVLDVTEPLHECIAMKNLAEFLTAETLPTPLPFSLRTLIASVISSVSKSFKAHHKEIRCTTPQYLPDLFLGNQSAISRVLLCLLGNALENDEGDEIHLKADLKGKNSSSTCIQFAIEFKSGCVASNCFESMQEFLTGLHLIEEKQCLRGTGLNLAAALIEKMGGAAWVKNMMYRGSTYYFSLNLSESPAADAAVFTEFPLHKVAAEEHTGAHFRMSGIMGKNTTARPRILLADDNEVDRLTICRLLESMDYDVIQVSNGREAVEEFDGSCCDAVLMDILMPEMDGFEATRMIREKERLVGKCHTPIIALTSYTLKAIHEKCVSVGMDSYLHKPVSALEITKLFSSVIAGDSSPSEMILSERDIEQLPLLDIQDTLENLANNADLYREVMDLFTANISSDHQDLLAAIRSGVLADIVKISHKVMGMAANVGAKRYAELAEQIQNAALDGDIGAPERWLHRLSIELPRLQTAITALDWQKLH